jgi:P-type Cu+ transporter
VASILTGSSCSLLHIVNWTFLFLSFFCSPYTNSKYFPQNNTEGKYSGEKEIDASLVQPGDALKVLPGSKVPADGIVIWGTSHVNESMVTGESVPISKEVSSLVIGGTMNLHGVLHIQATKVGSGTVLSQIISLVETAQMSKAPIQKFADYVSTLFNSLAYKNNLLTLYYNLKSAKH